MKRLRGWIIRLFATFYRRGSELEFEEEIEIHLELHTEDNILAGMTHEEARRQAVIRLGGIGATKERYRDQRGLPLLETMRQDLMFGIRTLRKNPGFTVVAILTLALGIGANTAIFSLIDTVLLRPLPFEDAKQLIDLAEINAKGERNYVSGGVFKDWALQDTLLSQIAIYHSLALNLTGSGTPERVTGLEVTSSYLPLLRVQPIMGRGFQNGDDTKEGNNRSIILSYGFWQTHFGADSAVVGKYIALDQTPYLIVGVLPPKALLDDKARFLVPAVIDADGRWGRADGNWWARVIGRAKPGVSAAQVDTELKTIRRRLTAEYPTNAKNMSVAAVPFQQIVTAESRPTLVMLFCTVLIVLLIACVNVANLLLARGSARGREMAIRSALGAHSRRLIRQMMTESFLLASAGCVTGLIFAIFGIELARRMTTSVFPEALRPELDGRVFAFAVIAGCGCALLFGLFPALRASRPNLNLELRETDRSATSGSGIRSQSLLIVIEVAFTLVLLVGAGLSIRGFSKLSSTDLGFDPRGTLTFNLSFPPGKYSTAKARGSFVEELETRIRQLPGVQYVGFSSALPLTGDGFVEALSRKGRAWDEKYFAGADMVSRDFFEAVGTPLLRGRALNDADFVGDVPKVCILSQGVVDDLFPGEDPLGKQVQFWGATMEVAGVVPNVYHGGLSDGARSTIYLPGLFPNLRQIGLAIRTAVPPLTLVNSVRGVLQQLDPDLPMADVRTLDQALFSAMSRWRTTLVLIGFFAFLAVSLACIGLYGVIAYSVSQRRREISIRMALGADRRTILKLILGRSLMLTLTGTVIGVAIALGGGGFLSNQVFGIPPRDLPVTVCAALAMILVALLAAYMPSRRATGLNPVVALRND